MELDRALSQISEIHAQLLRSEVFRGYRALPTAVTSIVAVMAAVLQTSIWPASTPTEFVIAWAGVATLCSAICAGDLWVRARRSEIVRRRALPVVAQFAPATIAGCVITIALLRAGSDALSLMPGVWALVMGIGIMASRPYLPRAIGFVALFYLATGAMLVSYAEPASVPSAWTMGATFGAGQALAAVVLFFNLERGGVRG